LELYLHEAGTKTLKFFPTPEVFRVIEKRAKELQRQLLGYHVLPFAHGKNEKGEDFGLLSIQNPFDKLRMSHELLRAVKTETTGEFQNLAQHLWAFAESEAKRRSKPLGFVAITYCRTCKNLCLIHKREEVRCYHCLKPFTGRYQVPPFTHLQLSKYRAG
jgi:hypothetical protein